MRTRTRSRTTFASAPGATGLSSTSSVRTSIVPSSWTSWSHFAKSWRTTRPIQARPWTWTVGMASWIWCLNPTWSPMRAGRAGAIATKMMTDCCLYRSLPGMIMFSWGVTKWEHLPLDWTLKSKLRSQKLDVFSKDGINKSCSFYAKRTLLKGHIKKTRTYFACSYL